MNRTNLVAGSVISMAIVFASACGSNADPPNDVPTERPTEHATPQAANSTATSALPQAFGFRRIQSLSETEAYVGYPLAVSKLYDPVNGFFVQPEVSESTPNPAVKVIYKVGSDPDVYVTMGPEWLWSSGVFDGDRTDIAGRSAVVFERDEDFIAFAFQIASLEGKPIWYSVSANNLDDSQLDAFVRSIVLQ